MSNKTRTLEELVTLQDQAIEALKQALAATQLALDVLQKNRNEKGFSFPIDFTPTPTPNPPGIPYVVPQPQILPGWGQTWVNSQPGEVFSTDAKWTMAGGGKLTDGMTSFLPVMDKLVATSGLMSQSNQSNAVTLDSQYASAEQTLQNAQTVHNVAVAYLASLKKESDEHFSNSYQDSQGGVRLG